MNKYNQQPEDPEMLILRAQIKAYKEAAAEAAEELKTLKIYAYSAKKINKTINKLEKLIKTT